MSRWMSLVGVLLVLFLVVVPAQAAKDEPPSPDDQAEAYAKQYKKGFKKMSSADRIAGIDKLVEWYKRKDVTDKKAKKAILDALSRATQVKDKTVVAHVLKRAAEMDDAVLKFVLPALNRELGQKAPDETVYGTALATLGKLRSKNKLAIKTLVKLLKDKEDTIVQLACRAIAGYGESDGATRKELFEEVLKAVEGTYSGSQNNNQTAERKWNIIGDDAMEALQKLSHVKLQDPVKSRHWFNEHKKKSWDPEKK